MNKLKIFCTILIGIVLFSSCSDDDESTDIIVGRWQAIQMLEMNQIVEMPVCLPFTYIEFRANKTASGGKINSSNLPDECNLLMFDFVQWENLGNSRYRINAVMQEGTISKVYKEAENLIFETLDGSTKTIYQSY